MALLDRPPGVLRLHHAFAAHAAGVAGVVLLEDRIGHLLARDGLEAVELPGVVVEGREAADRVLKGDDTRRPVLLQAYDIPVGLDLARSPARQLVDLFGIGPRELLAGAAHDNRLEFLRAHDGAHPGTSIG